MLIVIALCFIFRAGLKCGSVLKIVIPGIIGTILNLFQYILIDPANWYLRLYEILGSPALAIIIFKVYEAFRPDKRFKIGNYKDRRKRK